LGDLYIYPPSSAQVFTAQAMARTKKQAVDKSPATNVDKQGHVDGCDLSGIARDWDQDTELKDRLLEGGAVLDPATKPKTEDNKTCQINDFLLTPILQKMSLLDKRPIPAIDDLRDEVTTLLILSKRTGNDVVSVVEETAQTIKKLLVFVKAKTRRREVSTATWLKPICMATKVEVNPYRFDTMQSFKTHGMSHIICTSLICLRFVYL
jgi:hypothetical protein